MIELSDVWFGLVFRKEVKGFITAPSNVYLFHWSHSIFNTKLSLSLCGLISVNRWFMHHA